MARTIARMLWEHEEREAEERSRVEKAANLTERDIGADR